MNDIFYHGVWRMDWGLGNPNKTAGLIATLMNAVWGLAYIRRWGYWLAVVLFAVLGGCLIHTFSRGGLIALFAGVLPLVWYAPRPWSWKRVLPVVLAIWVMIGMAIFLNADERYGQGIVKEDRSISSRIEIWKHAPQMMVDAPHGWGLGNAGPAYANWYQPLDRSETYLNLINSHLTWLVEFGWPARFVYVLLWIGALVICWPQKNAPTFFSIALGVWIAFAVAATFSAVAESPWLWIVPVICLIVVVGYRVRNRFWPSATVQAVPFGAAALAMAIICWLGRGQEEIRKSHGSVIVGGGEPSIWIVVDSRTMGETYGMALRRYRRDAPTMPTIGISDSPSFLPDVTGKTVEIARRAPSKEKFRQVLSNAQKVVLLNPSFFPQEVGLNRSVPNKLSVVYGEFSQSPAVNAWNTDASVEKVDGAGDFLASWPAVILKEAANE